MNTGMSLHPWKIRSADEQKIDTSCLFRVELLSDVGTLTGFTRAEMAFEVLRC